MKGNAMAPKLITCIAAGIVCLVCVFTAVERYQANANAVRAMKEMDRRMGGGMLREDYFAPAIPAASKYATLFALISGGVAVTAFITHKREQSAGERPQRTT